MAAPLSGRLALRQRVSHLFRVRVAADVAEGGDEKGLAAFQPELPMLQTPDPLGELADFPQFAFDPAESPHDFAVGIHIKGLLSEQDGGWGPPSVRMHTYADCAWA